MMNKKEKLICCICGNECENNYGNNPYPLSTSGKCCNTCNIKVLQCRMKESKIKSDYKNTDDLLNIINANDFIVIASRPSMGKSTLGYNIINKVSKRTKGNILYFNYETSKDLLKSKITGNNIEIIDDTTITIEQIKSKCESTNNLSLVVIDYIQLIPNSCSDISVKQIDYISRTLKTITLKLNIPIIVLSQLGRQVEERESKRPILRDLDVIGSLVQDSNKVIFLYRENYYNKEYELNDIELIVAKNRGGSIGTIKMLFKDKGSPNE